MTDVRSQGAVQATRWFGASRSNGKKAIMHDRLRSWLTSQFLPIRVVGCLAFANLLAFAVANDSKEVSTTRTRSPAGRMGHLQPLNSLVGQWRGVGQPKRGSRRGAWQETTVCRWDFSGDKPAVLLEAEKGAQFQQLRFAVSSSEKQLQLTQQISGQESRVYEGLLPESWPGKIKLESGAADDGSNYRCTIEQLSPIRLVVLFERRATVSASYRRVAGIGYTRSGRKLADGGGSQRECVVTGGQGTSTVKHKGKIWFVCCDGCRQAFEDSPDEIIAEYLSRKND